MGVEEILEKVRRGDVSIGEAKKQLEFFMVRDVEDFAKIDVGRHLRKGVPEIIFAENKSPAETAKIAEEMVKHTGKAIISRVSEEHLKELKKVNKNLNVEVYDKARMVVVRRNGVTSPRTGGKAGVLTAGTADVSVAEEAVVMLREAGCDVYTAYDVGVAGLHRLFKPLKEMLEKGVDVLVVVAGMEGALPSLVASLVNCPVIGVPVSAGYGYGCLLYTSDAADE